VGEVDVPFKATSTGERGRLWSNEVETDHGARPITEAYLGGLQQRRAQPPFSVCGLLSRIATTYIEKVMNLLNDVEISRNTMVSTLTKDFTPNNST
jgi:hypothetical protein